MVARFDWKYSQSRIDRVYSLLPHLWDNLFLCFSYIALERRVCTFEQIFREKDFPELLSRKCDLRSTGEQIFWYLTGKMSVFFPQGWVFTWRLSKQAMFLRIGPSWCELPLTYAGYTDQFSFLSSVLIVDSTEKLLIASNFDIARITCLLWSIQLCSGDLFPDTQQPFSGGNDSSFRRMGPVSTIRSVSLYTSTIFR